MKNEKKEFIVYWTFWANHAESPRRVFAKDFVEAAERSISYDPYCGVSGKRMKFLVFEVGGDLVHFGELPEKEKIS